MDDKKLLCQYKQLLERRIRELNNAMECPCHLDPWSEGLIWRKSHQEALTYALEMLPGINCGN